MDIWIKVGIIIFSIVGITVAVLGMVNAIQLLRCQLKKRNESSNTVKAAREDCKPPTKADKYRAQEDGVKDDR